MISSTFKYEKKSTKLSAAADLKSLYRELRFLNVCTRRAIPSLAAEIVSEDIVSFMLSIKSNAALLPVC